MLREARQSFILNELKIRNRVLLVDIAQRLSVSEDTIRRDLKEMDGKGQLTKVHGGAIAKSFYPFSYNKGDIYDQPNKELIANKAVSLIRSGQTALITGGTTNLEFISKLPADLSATFFTPSLQAATQLAKHPSVEVILIGGKVSREAQVSLGADAVNALSQIKADLCFLGTGYVDLANGLSEFDWDVVQLKKAMIRSSNKIISLILSAKLNSAQRYQVCPIQSIHTLVTELDPGDPMLKDYCAVCKEMI